MSVQQQRCLWAESDPLLRKYHDEEWGVPDFDSRSLWERLTLESFQAGLAWIIVLRKRATIQAAFRQCDPTAVATFGEPEILTLLGNPGIIRSRAKIQAAIGGARAFLDMRNAGINFSDWVWDFVGSEAIQNSGPTTKFSPLAETVSRELKRRGFQFVGATIAYAWMQAVGMVNDHVLDCFRREFCAQKRKRK